MSKHDYKYYLCPDCANFLDPQLNTFECYRCGLTVPRASEWELQDGLMLGSIVPGPFDFAGRYGPPNETVAPEHLAVCMGYGEDGRPEFGSYVVYPSTDRRGPSRSYVLTGTGRGKPVTAADFNRAMMHTVQPPPDIAGKRGDKLIGANGKPSS